MEGKGICEVLKKCCKISLLEWSCVEWTLKLPN